MLNVQRIVNNSNARIANESKREVLDLLNLIDIILIVKICS